MEKIKYIITVEDTLGTRWNESYDETSRDIDVSNDKSTVNSIKQMFVDFNSSLRSGEEKRTLLGIRKEVTTVQDLDIL